MNTISFLTVKQFPQKHPAFKESGLRSWIFNEETNGLKQSGAIVRVGRKVVINEALFFAWIQGGAA